MKSGRHHYNRGDLLAAIRAAGIIEGDTVSLQASLGRLGFAEGASGYVELTGLVVGAFLEVLGPSGTLIVPTYTYSFGRGEDFDVDATPAAIGEFPEIFRRMPRVLRSRDPMLSNAGQGALSREILRSISNSCFGAGSVFDNLRKVDAKICTLGISLYWATFRHHIEEMAEVPFRYPKVFRGKIIEGGIVRDEAWTYFAAPLDVPNCEPNGLPLEKLARSAGIVSIATVGRGELMCVRARDYFEFGVEQIQQSPWLTAMGPPCDISVYISHEKESVRE